MKKAKKLFILPLLFLSLLFVPQNANAGKHKDQYGHSWTACAWGDLSIKVFGVVIKESNPYQH